ncbi:5-methyltetrahydropteroyltriglutamate--homocysteine S-methyltransferase [Pectobacteriaceae bacterium CE90]|nr:5-methyltetrahydropteroyltriglutamate--homocysteine S-methyltransferase [Pectobacteriaceae bacterium CE90]
MSRTVKKNYPPFHADHVGSFLQPSRLKQARAEWEQGRLSRDKLTEIEDEEVLRVVENQKACGLRAITDGELRRSWWHFDFFDHLQGLESYNDTGGESFNTVQPRTHHIRVVDKIDFDVSHPFLEHYRFLHKAVGIDGRSLAKQTLPSPTMLMHSCIRENTFYTSLEAYSDDLANAYRKAILAFYDAGCRYLQLDDVFLAYLFDLREREKEQEAGIDLQYLLDICVRTLNLVLEVRPEDMYISMHICRGSAMPSWIYQDGYDAIGYVIASVNVNGLFLEYDDDYSGSLELLRHITHQKVVLGVVTPHKGELEDSAAIKMAVNTASLYVPLQQLALGPLCGFSSTHGEALLTEEQQWAKLRHIVNIAQEVWTMPD